MNGFGSLEDKFAAMEVQDVSTHTYASFKGCSSFIIVAADQRGDESRANEHEWNHWDGDVESIAI